MSKRTNQAEQFAELARETEWVAQHVAELGRRIAASAKRRASSSIGPAQEEDPCPRGSRTPTGHVPRVAPSPEPSSSFARWLPSLEPTHLPAKSAGRVKIQDAGRYIIVNPRQIPSGTR
jgi:hypothetical protein